MPRLFKGASVSAALCFMLCVAFDSPNTIQWEQNIVYSVVAAAVFVFFYSLTGNMYPRKEEP